VNLDVLLEELLPHPIDEVWSALTDAEAIADWLMVPTGFQPAVGARFTLKTRNLSTDGWVQAEVLELDPPRRMVWAWTVDGGAAPTAVTFELTPEAGGTRLRLSHVGEIDAVIGGLLREGWPGRIDELRRTLDRRHGDAHTKGVVH
jgi:uncharacterized protein YndB with AHSA1/START domain